jgi:hypothetical protein
MFGNNNQPYGGYNQQQNYGGYPQQQAPATKLESLDDLLTGSGAKSYFNGDSQPGATITGTLDLIETSQMRDFQTKQPSFWNDGRPQMQIHIVIQTNLHDPAVEDDDGRRSIWIKGWGIQLKAFREACQKAGVKKPHKGDQFTATFTGYGERGNAPQPPKVYEYQIQHHDGVDTLLGQPQQPQTGYSQPQNSPYGQQQPTVPPYGQPPMGNNTVQPAAPTFQQAPAQYAQQPPVQQPAPTAPVPQVNVMQLQQLQAAGKNLTDIAGLTGLTEQQVIEALQPTHQGSEDEPEF